MAQPFQGWDFSYLEGRWQSSSVPWDYRGLVMDRAAQAHTMLDVGTGGGEFLSALLPLPPRTLATEAYGPNVRVAHRRLSPLGVPVVQLDDKEGNLLPFANTVFDLVIDRHEGYRASEIFRILRPGGRFLTQQVGGENCMDINRALQEAPSAPYQFWTHAYELDQLRAAGFTILQEAEAFPPLIFRDIGALVFYLKVVPWQVEDFSIERYREKLLQIHYNIEKFGPMVVREHRTLVEAVR